MLESRNRRLIVIAQLSSLEEKLEDQFSRKVPLRLPESVKRIVVKNVPYITLFLSLVTLLTAWWLWSWAHTSASEINYVNSITNDLSKPADVSSRLTIIVWIGLAVRLIQAYVLFVAYSPSKTRKKRAWELLFYAAFLNVLYGLLIIFTAYGGISHLLWSLLTSLVGLFFLFQIKRYYFGRVTPRTQPDLTDKA
jgi:hypothetical protein